MKKRRSWISLVGFCIAAVMAASLAFATIVAGASVALASHRAETDGNDGKDIEQATPAPQESTTFTGIVTDSHCGARHMRNSHQNAPECARACFRQGASFVLVDGSHRYTLVGEESALSKLAGERTNITGTRQGDTILVDSAGEALF